MGYKVEIDGIGEVEVSDDFPNMTPEKQKQYISSVGRDYAAKNPTMWQRFTGAMSEPTRGKAETFKSVGMPELGGVLESAADFQSGATNPALNPDNRLKLWGGDPNAEPNVTGWAAQAAGDVVGPLALWTAGSALGGGPESPAGWATGTAALFSDEIMSTLGTTVRDVAQANGHDEPTADDWGQAAVTSGSAAAINAVGQSLGFKYLKGKGGTVRNVTAATVPSGLSSAAADTVNQVGTTIASPDGVKFDPNRTINAAAEGVASMPVAEGINAAGRTAKSAVGLPGRLAAGHRAATDYSKNPDQVSSDLRVADLYDAKVKTAQAYDVGHDIPEDQHFKGIKTDIKRSLTELADAAFRAGDIDAEGRKAIKEITADAARHNQAQGEGGAAVGYFDTAVERVEALGLPAATEKAVLNSLRDLDTATFNGMKKNRVGPLESAARASNIGPAILGGIAGGATLGPWGAGIGAVAANRAAIGIGRLGDKFLGTQKPPILSRAAARRKLLAKKGVNYGNTVKDLQAAIADAGARTTFIKSQKDANLSPVDRQMRDLGVQRGGGWLRSLQTHANEILPTDKKVDQGHIYEAINELKDLGVLTQDHVDQMMGDRNGAISDERIYYALQDFIVHRAGGLDQAPVLDLTGGTPPAEGGPAIPSGIRNRFAYKQTMENVKAATDTAHQAAPNDDLKALVTRIADARTPEAKREIYDQFLKANPDKIKFLVSQVKPLTEFGPKKGDTTLRSGIDPNDVKKHLIDPLVGAVKGMLNPAVEAAKAKWFKGSKIVNDDGTPMTVYHWTYGDFDEFDRSKGPKHLKTDGVDSLGHWFTDNINRRYANTSPEWGGKRYDVHLAMKKPYYIVDEQSATGQAWNHLNEMVTKAGSAKALREELQAQGYDGIVLNGTILDGKKQNAMIAFEPNQIKSVNDTKFDPDSKKFRSALAEQTEANEPLKGLPRNVKVAGKPLEVGPSPEAREVAKAYMAEAGMKHTPPTTYVKADAERGKRIADEYANMKNDPNDPLVKASYEALIKETLAQWEAIKKTGLKVEFIDYAKTGDPYAASPRLAVEDIVKNNHFWVFATADGYGDSLVNIGLKTNDGKGITVEQAKKALEDVGVSIKDTNELVATHDKGEERTLVASLSRALTPEEAHRVSEVLDQDAIAHFGGGKGGLYGPKAKEWGEFNPEFFFTLDGRKGTEVGLDNPMLAPTSEMFGDKPTVANDIFRVVHDYFGHAKEGVGFRADGEENAWRSHAAMYSDLARLAATSETRGQNSWVNYGPQGERNKTASGADTVYAEQKVGIMPDWVYSEGADDFLSPVDTAQLRADLTPNGKEPPPVAAVLKKEKRVITPEEKKFNDRIKRDKGVMVTIRNIIGDEYTLEKNLINRVPGIKAILPYLTAKEVQNTNAKGAASLLNMFRNTPSSEEMAHVAISGKAKRGWYQTSAKAIIDIFGKTDAPRFTALLASMSPQCSVETNAINALNMWVNWHAAGRPTDERSIRALMGKSVQGDGTEASVLEAWAQNTVRSLSAEKAHAIELSGNKVDSFMRNLNDVVHAVTNDAWMANYGGVSQDKFAGVAYGGYSAKVRQAAEVATKITGETWTPAEIQETIWSWSKALYELRNNKGNRNPENLTANQLLKAGRVTNQMVADTPDFATLFTEGALRTILEKGGFSDQLDSVRAGRSSAPADAEHLGKSVYSAEGKKVDRLTHERHLNRAGGRLERLRQARLASGNPMDERP